MTAQTSEYYVAPAAPAVCNCPVCTRSPRGGRGGYCRVCAELCTHGVALCVDLETGLPRPAPRREQRTVQAPPAAPEGLPIAEHARRTGRPVAVVTRALERSGLKVEKGRPGRGGMLFPADHVDAALQALDVERPTPPPPPPRVEAPPPPSAVPRDFAEVDPATGCARWCETCAALAAVTRRRRPCRWCREGKPPLRYDGGAP